MWVSCNDILEGLPLDNGATGELVVPHPMTRVIVTDNTRGHSSEIDEGFFGRQIQDRSVIDRFWHMRMEGLGEAEEASLLAATADQDWLAEFEPEVLDRLFKALARLGADSRAAAQAQAIGFESRAVPLSFRVLSRMRNMMLDAARMPAASDDDPLRRIIRTSLTEALDSTARETAETLAVTAIAMAWLIDTCVLDFMQLNVAKLLTGFTCGVELWSFLENAAQLSDAPLFRWLRRYVHRRIRKEAGDE